MDPTHAISTVIIIHKPNENDGEVGDRFCVPSFSNPHSNDDDDDDDDDDDNDNDDVTILVLKMMMMTMMMQGRMWTVRISVPLFRPHSDKIWPDPLSSCPLHCHLHYVATYITL